MIAAEKSVWDLKVSEIPEFVGKRNIHPRAVAGAMSRGECFQRWCLGQLSLNTFCIFNYLFVIYDTLRCVGYWRWMHKWMEPIKGGAAPLLQAGFLVSFIMYVGYYPFLREYWFQYCLHTLQVLMAKLTIVEIMDGARYVKLHQTLAHWLPVYVKVTSATANTTGNVYGLRNILALIMQQFLRHLAIITLQNFWPISVKSEI